MNIARLVRWRRADAGFSFIELVISAAILGVLASVAMPLAENQIKRQKEHDLRVALQDIRHAVDAYKQATLNGNVAIQTGQSGYPPTLTELAAGSPDVQHPNGPLLYFLRRIPRDPFFPDTTTASIDTWGKRSFASPPDSPREGDDVFDVYSLSTQTGMNGVPYAQW
jgi:general secretion pathway protein G